MVGLDGAKIADGVQMFGPAVATVKKGKVSQTCEAFKVNPLHHNQKLQEIRVPKKQKCGGEQIRIDGTQGKDKGYDGTKAELATQIHHSVNATPKETKAQDCDIILQNQPAVEMGKVLRKERRGA